MKIRETIGNNKGIIVSVLLVLAVIIAGLNFVKPSNNSTFDTVAVKKDILVKEVSASGRVKPMESVDLSFEKSGKVLKVYADIGDEVKAGDLLVTLEADDLRADLSKAEAGLQSARASLFQSQAAFEAEKAKLAELKIGTRTESIKLAETDVLNAQKALLDSEANMDNVVKKNKADTDQAYDGAKNAAIESTSAALKSLFMLTDIQFAHFGEYTQDGIKIAEAKASAVYALLGAKNGGYMSNEALSRLNGGAKEIAAEAQSNTDIDSALVAAREALEKTKESLNSVPLVASLTAAENTSLNTEKNNINDEITTIASKQKAIAMQKTTSENSVSVAQMRINDSKNLLASAEDALALKKAGSTAEQIAAEEAQVRRVESGIETEKARVKQAEASIKSVNVQISKTILRSPIDGIVAKQDAKKGQIISLNTPIASLISKGKFEAEVNVAEGDIVNVEVGQKARISLDAFGGDAAKEVIGTVAKIDPSKTLSGGATYYKTTIAFDENNEQIKDGMTADVWIKVKEKKDAIVIPLAAVREKNGKNYVEIPDGETAKEKEVSVGEKGNGGVIEIISGLTEGENIILSNKNDK